MSTSQGNYDYFFPFLLTNVKSNYINNMYIIVPIVYINMFYKNSTKEVDGRKALLNHDTRW